MGPALHLRRLIDMVKKRIVLNALVLFALWPAVHHGLVRTRGLNPWKLFGWSMYCLPPKRRIGSIKVSTGGRPERRTLPPEIHKAYLAYRQNRAVLGRRVKPDRVAAMIFEEFPKIDRVDFEIEEISLNTATGRMESRQFLDTYHKPAPPDR